MIRLKLTSAQRVALQEMRRDRTITPAERDRVEKVLLSTAGWLILATSTSADSA